MEDSASQQANDGLSLSIDSLARFPRVLYLLLRAGYLAFTLK